MGSAGKMLKLLTSVVLVCTVSTALGGRAPKLDVVYGSHHSNNLPSPVRVSRKEETGRQDVCMTEVCQAAAVSLADAMDITADPCDDFYKFACGGWMAKNSIPEGKAKWGRFYELRDKVDRALYEIVTMDEEGAASSVNNMRLMYQACMDTDTIESVGYSKIDLVTDAETGWPILLGADAADGSIEFATFLGMIKRNPGLDLIFSMWVYMDDLDTSKNVVYVDQPDLGLPQSMYLDEDSYTKYIEAYKQYIFDIALLLRDYFETEATDDEISADVEAIYALEKKLAMIMIPDSERRNSTAMYNPMKLSELEELVPLNFTQYFEAVFSPLDITIPADERIIVVQPDYLVALNTLDEVSYKDVANYLWARIMMTVAPEFDQAMRDAAFKYSSVMTGITTQQERKVTCTAKATGAWGFAAAHEYIMRYFESSAKDEANLMVEDLRAAFKELVTETQWMDSQTQATATGKADQMLQLMGYPDWLTHEDELDEYFAGTQDSDVLDHFGNVQNMKFWATGKELSELRQAPARDVWLMHPAIVNAWYSPNHNTITFPAGILQPPFFQSGLPRYLNYGAMGMVIGHEITHGFDDHCRQYDGTGNLRPWWSEETLQGFLGRAQCFIAQYGNYTVPELEDILGEDAHLNGKNTQGENIADNGGIHESFRAYLRSLENGEAEPSLPGLEQFTPKQMFFVSNAQVWCELQTADSLLGQVLSDPHSPGRFRVIGPHSNSEDFQREWNCPADSAMVRQDKCQLW